MSENDEPLIVNIKDILKRKTMCFNEIEYTEEPVLRECSECGSSIYPVLAIQFKKPTTSFMIDFNNPTELKPVRYVCDCGAIYPVGEDEHK